MSALLAAVILGAASVASAQWPEGVQATGTMGVTNPTAAVMGTQPDQASMSRLISVNSIDDFCLFAPPSGGAIGDTEAEEVAWCTKPRNNARLIPDGTLTGVSFLKTEFYVQIIGFGDFTKINLAAGDYGGELDPHGASGAGNPVGGNVTTTVTGSYLEVAEWMQYIAYNQFCLRACTNANGTYSAAAMCEHRLDVMGCEFVMPGNYDVDGKFESCDADVAYPPGWYPTATADDGSVQFSTFAQYFTGVYTANGTPVSYTVGDLTTPTAVASVPSSSNCVAATSIANGLTVNADGSVSGSIPAQVEDSATATGAPPTQTAAITQATTSAVAAATGVATTASGKSTIKTSAAAAATHTQVLSPSSSASDDTTASADASGALPRLIPGASALVGMALASVFAIAGGVVVVL